MTALSGTRQMGAKRKEALQMMNDEDNHQYSNQQEFKQSGQVLSESQGILPINIANKKGKESHVKV